MIIPPNEVKNKKQIGHLGNDPVYRIELIGGLNLIAVAGKKTRIIGAAPHQAISLHLAREKEPDMVITELSKGEHYGLETFSHLLPMYRTLTDKFNR